MGISSFQTDRLWICAKVVVILHNWVREALLLFLGRKGKTLSDAIMFGWTSIHGLVGCIYDLTGVFMFMMSFPACCVFEHILG